MLTIGQMTELIDLGAHFSNYLEHKVAMQVIKGATEIQLNDDMVIGHIVHKTTDCVDSALIPPWDPDANLPVAIVAYKYFVGVLQGIFSSQPS